MDMAQAGPQAASRGSQAGLLPAR
eukprot:COSAG01_NODE_44085_length_422_cov_5.021672_2_plen_23_part_01